MSENAKAMSKAVPKLRPTDLSKWLATENLTVDYLMQLAELRHQFPGCEYDQDDMACVGFGELVDLCLGATLAVVAAQRAEKQLRILQSSMSDQAESPPETENPR